MTLVSDIINDAYRESNTIPLGRPATVLQTTEALRLYNQFISSTYGGEEGEKLRDWTLGSYGQEFSTNQDLYLNPLVTHPDGNRRLIATNTTPLVVYLTPYPQDGMQYGMTDPFNRLAAFPIILNANGRPIEGGLTLVCNTNGLYVRWIYRGDIGAWIRITPLLATDPHPFPAQYDIFFSISLAMRINPRYGRTLDQQSLAAYKQNRREFIARYIQDHPLERDDSIAFPFMSKQSFNCPGNYNGQNGFNTGSTVGDVSWAGEFDGGGI